MRYIILTVLVIFFCIGCGNSREGEIKPSLASNLFSITDNEDKGIKDIIAFYGGYCEYSVGKVVASNENNQKYFEIKLSKSEGLDKYETQAMMPISNIAFRFFKFLNEKERTNYTHIKPVLLFASGAQQEKKVAVSELQLVHDKIMIIEELVQVIRKKKFGDLGKYLNDKNSYVSYDKNELISNLEKFDSQFGNVMEEGFRLFGYNIKNLDNGIEVLHISGFIVRDKQSNEFSVDFDLNSQKREVLMLNYRL